MMHHDRLRRWPRPPWWPENEPWPPQRRRRHAPFFRRMGCAFVLLPLVVWGVLIAVVLSVARAIGWITFGGVPLSIDLPAVAGIIIAAVIVIAFVVWSLRRVSIPLDELVEAADRVAAGDYSVRVREHGPRAVASLARAFNEMASRLDSTQSDRRSLLADVTHEMRTPLTVMRGNLEGMLDGVYPPDQTSLAALLEETKLLSRLIDDLQTLALAESGALQLKLEATDLGGLIRDVIAGFQAQAAAAGVSLKREIASGLPAMELDPGRMRQVLTNLLANALRYTPDGGMVSVTSGMRGARCVIEVRDTGAGISSEDLPHVFERFYRSTDSGGMGLGLAIARHLVEAHGGTLTATSERGNGTSMRISLPAPS